MRAPAIVIGASVLIASTNIADYRRQTLAPHELNSGDAPAAIVWSTPELPRGHIDFESAAERTLRAVVLARHLEQPWSVAFLPNGTMLVTERVGRVRVIRDGHLDPHPVAGVPQVQTGGPRGLQGLMDIALHPQFAQNHFVYLAYHKPTTNGGTTTLARGRWDGNALVDVQDI